MCTKTFILLLFYPQFFGLFTKTLFSPIFYYNSSYPTNNIYNVYQFSKQQSHFP